MCLLVSIMVLITICVDQIYSVANKTGRVFLLMDLNSCALSLTGGTKVKPSLLQGTQLRVCW